MNLLFCVYWGIAAIAWVKLLYPAASFLLEKIPPVAGKIMTWIIVIFMVLDMAVSGAAISRYVSRKPELKRQILLSICVTAFIRIS